jgi:hypothetical protein
LNSLNINKNKSIQIQKEMSTIEVQKEQNVFPPEPPSEKQEEKINLGSGDFAYVQNTNERRMLQTAFKAITLTESWSIVREPIDSFMLSGDKRIHKIYHKIEELGYHGHSGTSFGCTMRNMQFIAQHGEEKFREMFYK